MHDLKRCKCNKKDMYGGQKEVVNMSNYAPNPDKIPMYEQLNTFAPFDEGLAPAIANITQNMKVQGINQDDMIALDIINKAVYRDGNPMPRGIKIVTTTVTDNPTVVGFTVPKGEVYQLVTIGANAVSPSGQNDYRFFQSGTDTDGNEVNMNWFIYSTSNNTAPVFQADADFPDMPMFYDENTTFKFSVSGSYTSVTLSVSMIRVR